MPRPFDGLRVVELGERIGSSYAAKLLADLGASVIKLESTTEKGSRDYGPFAGANPDREKSGLFGFLNAGKRSALLSAVIDSAPTGLYDLLAAADIVVSGLSPLEFERLVVVEKLRADNPGAVVACVTPFGLSGPYRDYQGTELVTAAMSGICRRIGAPGRSPLSPPLSLGGYQAGIAAAAGIASALIARHTLGKGQLVDVSEIEILSTVHAGYSVTRFQLAGNEENRGGHRFLNQPYPQTVLPCRDGLVELNAPEAEQWKRLLDLIGEEWTTNAKYASRMRNATEHADELDALIGKWLAQHDKEELFELFRSRGIPCGPIRTIDEVVNDPQLAARNFFSFLRFPDGTRVKAPGLAALYSRVRPLSESMVPRFGEHTAEVIKLEAITREARGPKAASAADGRFAKGPLSGLRVVDLGWVWAGAIPGQLLADMGAEVIKVESRARLDYMRMGRPLKGTVMDPEQNPWFHAVNRNKKSLAANLRAPRAVDLLKKLIAKSDIVLENFKPGFLQKLGLDYDALSKEDSRLIMLSMSGVGQFGPMADLPAYAPLLAALSGIDSLVGYRDEVPIGIQQPMADSNAGLCAAFAVLAAIYQRERTGVGQYIDLSEQAAAVSVLGEAVVQFTLCGDSPRPVGTDRRGTVPNGHFPCSESDSWIAISAGDEGQWQRLCQVLGATELSADERFATASARWDNRRELDQALAALTKRFLAMELMTLLQQSGVAAGTVNGPRQLLDDPHLRARRALVDIEHPVLGQETVFGVAWHLSDTPGGVRRHAPILGEHTVEVFCEWLGMQRAEVEALMNEGVLT